MKTRKSNSRMAGILSLTFLLAAVSGCTRHEPLPPMASEFVGRWKLDPSSLPSVVERTGKRPAESYLDLMPNGQAAVVNMPIESSFLTPEFQLLSRQGTWEIEKKQTWMLTLVFDRSGHSYYFKQAGGKPVALIHDVISPDSGESWVWRKSPDDR